jgi:hypothetical protein
MNSSARNSGTTSAPTPKSAAHQVACDLCTSPMNVPRHCEAQGAILGLLVCSQCVEDELNARMEIQP